MLFGACIWEVNAGFLVREARGWVAVDSGLVAADTSTAIPGKRGRY